VNKKALVFTGIGFECIGLIVAFVMVGEWLDKKFGWGGLGAGIGGMLGFFAWFIHVLILLKQFNKEEEANEDSSK
jgi:hypothetical protein